MKEYVVFSSIKGMKSKIFIGIVAAGLFSASFALASTPVPYPVNCPQLTIQLYRGMSDYYSGGQVTQLQQFLAARYGNQLVTGYFGTMTAANVVRFQQEQGLTPVGIVGPYTRAAIARLCGQGGNTSTTFRASPTNGQAPLLVSFTVDALPSGTDQGSISIDFGDGQTGKPSPIYCFAAPCSPVMSTQHTYTAAGTYTAKLLSDNNYCAPGMFCALMYREPTVLGTVVITVRATQSAPTISSIAPTQGPVGTQVAIYGSGFTQDNRVRFGSGGAVHVPSYNNGTLLYFTVPTYVGPCDWVGDTSEIRCLAAASQVTPGMYQMSVDNSNGQSNVTNFTVTY